MTERETPSMIAATRVRPGREDDFERFVSQVIAPAVQHARPHLAGMWQLWPPSADQPRDGTPAFVFAFYGEAPEKDWDLGSLFVEAHGEEEAARLLQQWADMVEDQTVYGLGEDL